MGKVANCLDAFDSLKSGGPDDVFSYLLEEFCQEIPPGFCALFNLSLHSARISLEWKKANVTAGHKNDLIEPAENYRPISPSLLFILNTEVLERPTLH